MPSTIAAPKTYWEGVARTRWGAYITRHEERELLRALALAEPPSEALEIGADGGRWTLQLCQRGWRPTCTDVNATTLAICQARVPEAHCVVVQAADTRLPAD